MRYRPTFGCDCTLCRQARLVIRDRQTVWLVKVGIVSIVGVALVAAWRWL